MLSKLLTAVEIAQLLKISKALSYRLIAEGQIPCVRIGRSVRVKPEDLERFIQEHSSTTTNFIFSADQGKGEHYGRQ